MRTLLSSFNLTKLHRSFIITELQAYPDVCCIQNMVFYAVVQIIQSGY